MFDGLVEAMIGDSDAEQRVRGVALATVTNNMDISGQGRVQLSYPWLPGVEPWARVAVMLAGSGRGTYFIPQVNDEVLVGFNHGNVREPYVLGCLWSTVDAPPARVPTDPVSKRIIKTPLGHEVEFDDMEQSITITSTTKQKVKLDASGIEVSTTGGTAKLSLGTAGDVTLEAKISLTIKAPMISIQGTTVDIKSDASATLDGGGMCTIKGGLVAIN